MGTGQPVPCLVVDQELAALAGAHTVRTAQTGPSAGQCRVGDVVVLNVHPVL